MPIQTHQVIIIGAHGLVGSSAFMHAAKLVAETALSSQSLSFHRKPLVLGLDQFPLGHTNGSSHGESRITRLAIGEGEDYVELAKRSQAITQDIQAKTGKQLMTLKSNECVPGLIIGPAAIDYAAPYHGSAGGFLQETTRIAKKNKIAHENLTNSEVAQRFPQFNIRDIDAGYCEDTMGYLNSDACIEANIALGKGYGGQINSDEAVLDIESMPDGRIRVLTSKQEYVAHNVIVTAGPWLPKLLGPELMADIQIYRQTVYWFEVEKNQREQFTKDKFPTFIWNLDSQNIIYGFPIMGDGNAIKISTESLQTITTPDDVDRTVSEAEKAAIYKKIKPRLPGVTSNCVKAITCLYTVAPKFRFVIDYLPDFNNKVIIASACSGHGAKHAAAIGEAIALRSFNQAADVDVIELFGGYFINEPAKKTALTML